MKYLQEAKSHQDFMVKIRRHMHEYPELSGKEFETIKYIKTVLDELGVEYVEVENGGILGKIVGKKEGKSVMLRADIDALPVQENKDNLKEGARVSVSKNEGCMHACGHDGHTAMLLGAAKILLNNKDDINGTVYLCFERGEEGTGNCKYIFKYIEDNNIKIDSAFAIHLYASLETGVMAINDAEMMAGAMGFLIEIEGKGGHGSRPDQSINPIDAFVGIYQGMQSLRLTKIDPYKPLTYSVGVLQGGNVGNVIPQSVKFGGSVRVFDREAVGLKFREEFKHLVDEVCKAYKCVPHYHAFSMPGFAVINDKECSLLAQKVIKEEIGTEKVVNIEPWMASESFARYLKLFPGVFAFLGVKNEAKGIGAAHHNHAFDIDEDVFPLGAAGAVKYAVEFLNSDIDTQSRKIEGGFKTILKLLDNKADLKLFYNE